MNTFWSKTVTPVEIPPPPWKWNPGEGFFFLGSCFAQDFAQELSSHFHPWSQSPFGQVYNPLSLTRSLHLLSGGIFEPEKEIFFHRGLWRHPDFHTAVTDPDREVLLARMNKEVKEKASDLEKSKILVLTLGTAWIWEKSDTKRIFSNCHTLAQGEFNHRLGTLEEMTAGLDGALKELETRNPDMKTVLTLSPIRHLSQGTQGNSVSKALLRIVCESLKNSRRWYFPAYELLMDEMRDYRWYSEDLVHPSPQGQGYIFRRFRDVLGTQALQEYWRQAEALGGLLGHRILRPGSEDDLAHQNNIKDKIKKFKESYGFARIPWHNMGTELQ